MITKQKFVEIICQLEEINDFVDETNSKARKLSDAIVSNSFNAMSLSISHETLVVELLENMFDCGDILSWWIYELDYGREFKIGDIQEEKNGKIANIDLSTSEKLYDYLTENRRKYEN